MVSTESLFLLVQALSKSEKRYFKLSASVQKGDKLYMKLFEVLEGASSYGTDLQAKLQELFPGSAIEPPRKHLYRTLMKSIRQFEADKNIEARLFSLLQDSRILFNKGLVNDCFNQLNKAKQLALQYEKFTFYLLLGRQELRLLSRLQFSGVGELQLIERQEKLRELLAYESMVQQQASIYEVLLLRYWKNGVATNIKDSLRLNDLLLEEHHILNSRSFDSFESKQLHLQFQSIYFLMASEPEQSLQIFYELDEQFQQHSQLWADTPIHYVDLLNGVLQTLRRMERFEDVPYFLNRLKDLSSSSESLKSIIEFQVLEHEMYRALGLKKYEQALDFIQLNEVLLRQETHRLPFQIQAQMWLTVSRVWYSVKNYNYALSFVNRALNLPHNSYNRPLLASCRLMNLLIHAALDNKDYLYYEIRSMERRLKAEQRFFRVESLVINCLKLWMLDKPLNSFQSQLGSLLEDPYEQQLIRELDLKSWIDGHSGNQ